MKTHYKIWGNPLKSYIELSVCFSRWLIGFGWGHYHYTTPVLYIYFNLGPIILLFSHEK